MDDSFTCQVLHSFSHLQTHVQQLLFNISLQRRERDYFLLLHKSCCIFTSRNWLQHSLFSQLQYLWICLLIVAHCVTDVSSYTTEPQTKDITNKGHLSIKDTFLGPKCSLSYIYIIIFYPDNDGRPCVAMTPWVTPHFN